MHKKSRQTFTKVWRLLCLLLRIRKSRAYEANQTFVWAGLTAAVELLCENYIRVCSLYGFLLYIQRCYAERDKMNIAQVVEIGQ